MKYILINLLNVKLQDENNNNGNNQHSNSSINLQNSIAVVDEIMRKSDKSAPSSSSSATSNYTTPTKSHLSSSSPTSSHIANGKSTLNQKLTSGLKSVKFKLNNNNNGLSDVIKKRGEIFCSIVENMKLNAIVGGGEVSIDVSKDGPNVVESSDFICPNDRELLIDSENKEFPNPEGQSGQQGYHQMRLPDGQMVLLLPPHYVQLAAALGLSAHPMVDQVPTPTDFENLIELNRRQQAIQNPADPNQTETSLDSAYWEHYKKSLATLSSMAEKIDTTICLQKNLKFALTEGNPPAISSSPSNIYPVKPQQQQQMACTSQMDIDETPNDGQEEKTKIVFNTETGPNNYSKKLEKMDEDVYNSRSPLYEQNIQNNQNLINENVESRGSNGSDDSMWRPW